MMFRNCTPTLILVILGMVLFSCNSGSPDQFFIRPRIDLAGEWQFSLDSSNGGAEEKWFLKDFREIVELPGTMDENKKGIRNLDTTTMHLNRVYLYEGPAWYRKKVHIPQDFKDKHLTLFFERSKSSRVWIDSLEVGQSYLLQSPQKFDVSDFLTPGDHSITVSVNNDLSLTPYGNVHIYSDDTQTNWNGILGEMYIEASDKTYISNLQVYPDVENEKVDIRLEVENELEIDSLTVVLYVDKIVDGVVSTLPQKEFNSASQQVMEFSYDFDGPVELWDDYEQPMYRLRAEITNHEIIDVQAVSFGMRSFEVDGTQFSINGRKTFLRGKHEAAVFPLTGYPPMTVEEWVRVYKIAKTYGINHYRFHTYCPPEAAFKAADQEGIFLQAELPFWGGMDSDTVARNQLEEGYALLKAYANHPSFVMFSPGNEIWGGHDKVKRNMLALKANDNRPLYTMGSNNNIGYMPPEDYVEFFVGARVPEHGNEIKGHARLTHAFADAEGGGILNTREPSTRINFSYAVSHMNIPLVSHEIGQYQIYPNYEEIKKYTGVLKAGNLEVFKNRLIKAGMIDQDSSFQKASGAWSALCYKAEMEAALRTEGMAGFQLLDLQDFPGQGTALVGILDAFMDSKGVITPEAWKESCNDVVLLLEFPKYIWTNDDTFKTDILVANYSNKKIDKSIHWEIKRQNDSLFNKGNFGQKEVDNGGLFTVGQIEVELSGIDKPEKLNIKVFVPNTPYENSYPIWVYPSQLKVEVPEEIQVTEQLDGQMMSYLEGGGKVLLFPRTEEVSGQSVPGHFPPEFWNFGMFRAISESVNKPVSPGTLGILADPEHPLFRSFPTDFHTNWQWFSIVKQSNSYILDETPSDYRPLVQVIDNLERNHKLGLIFEVKIGEGKLLVCMSRLTELQDRPEARQLYQSILDYMVSDDFDPGHTLDLTQLKGIF